MTIIEDLAIRGRKRLAVAKNAAAWALFGNDAEHETTIQAEDLAVAEIISIRVLTQLKEAGLLDNEPLLGLATTRELLNEIMARGNTGESQTDLVMAVTAEALLEKLEPEVLEYKTGTIKPIRDDDTLTDATVRGLLNELASRSECDPGGWVSYYATKALEDVPAAALDYTAANTVAVIEDEDPTNNGDDAEEADPK